MRPMTTMRHTTIGMKIQGSNFMVPKPKTCVLSFYKTSSPSILLMFVAFGGNCVVCLFRVMLVNLYACASTYFEIAHWGQIWTILCNRGGWLGHPTCGSSNLIEDSVPICRFYSNFHLFLHGCVRWFSSAYYINSLCVQCIISIAICSCLAYLLGFQIHMTIDIWFPHLINPIHR